MSLKINPTIQNNFQTPQNNFQNRAAGLTNYRQQLNQILANSNPPSIKNLDKAYSEVIGSLNGVRPDGKQKVKTQFWNA